MEQVAVTLHINLHYMAESQNESPVLNPIKTMMILLADGFILNILRNI